MKLSKARISIVDILKKSKSPVSALSFIKKLKVNKTTVYREIDKLLKSEIVVEVDFGDGKKRYELNDLKHHHHLICLKCSEVKDIVIDEQFNTPKDFKVIRHNLEFFGYCALCK